MIYNFEIEVQQQLARERLEWLIKNKRKVDIKTIRDIRTTSQNSYLHLLLSYFALEVGETLEFIKQEIFKRKVNKDIFVYERTNPKSGKVREDLRSSADIDTKEMTIAIDRFKAWTIKHTGIRLPDANEQNFLDHIKNEIEQGSQWL